MLLHQLHVNQVDGSHVHVERRQLKQRGTKLVRSRFGNLEAITQSIVDQMSDKRHFVRQSLLMGLPSLLLAQQIIFYQAPC